MVCCPEKYWLCPSATCCLTSVATTCESAHQRRIFPSIMDQINRKTWKNTQRLIKNTALLFSFFLPSRQCHGCKAFKLRLHTFAWTALCGTAGPALVRSAQLLLQLDLRNIFGFFFLKMTWNNGRAEHHPYTPWSKTCPLPLQSYKTSQPICCTRQWPHSLQSELATLPGSFIQALICGRLWTTRGCNEDTLPVSLWHGSLKKKKSSSPSLLIFSKPW